jgi:hypothetical protein
MIMLERKALGERDIPTLGTQEVRSITAFGSLDLYISRSEQSTVRILQLPTHFSHRHVRQIYPCRSFLLLRVPPRRRSFFLQQVTSEVVLQDLEYHRLVKSKA